MTRELAIVAALALVVPVSAPPPPIAVRHTEGEVHGFLALRSLGGDTLAAGDMMQTVNRDRVTAHIVLHFADGSLSDETATFTERGVFRLLTDHLIQRGPSFEKPLDMTLDVASGRVAVRYQDGGAEKRDERTMKLPADLANGILIVLLKNLPASAPEATLSFLAATPEPRLVKFVVTRAGRARFVIAGASREATEFVVKIDIGGVAGLVAPLIGKQPADSHVWVVEGESPAFVKSEAPMFLGGPVWRMELASPTWPESPSAPPRSSR